MRTIAIIATAMLLAGCVNPYAGRGAPNGVWTPPPPIISATSTQVYCYPVGSGVVCR